MNTSTEIPFAISNWKPMRKGALLGFFDCELPSGLVLKGCMLFEKGQRRWIGLPAKTFSKADGGTGYSPTVEIPDRARSDWFNGQCVRALVDEGVL